MGKVQHLHRDGHEWEHIMFSYLLQIHVDTVDGSLDFPPAMGKSHMYRAAVRDGNIIGVIP